MKILITGANGQLGTDLVRALSIPSPSRGEGGACPEQSVRGEGDAHKHHDVIPLTHSEADITDADAVMAACLRHRPDAIINTAAYVRVDDCETYPDLAFKVNVLGARNVAVAAEEIGAKLIHISTDYVFGGEANPSASPFAKGREHEAPAISPLSKGGSRGIPYTEFDIPVPLSVYGHSKLAGEDFVRHLCRRHFIVRASGLFGVAGSSGKGGNFIETILRLARERDKLTVVNDQVFSPTYTRHLATKIIQLLPTHLYGTYHITNAGECSWYDFAKEALRLAGSRTPILPITSDQYPQKARRPSYSVLDHYQLRLLGVDDLPTWQEALAEYMREKRHITDSQE